MKYRRPHYIHWMSIVVYVRACVDAYSSRESISISRALIMHDFPIKTRSNRHESSEFEMSFDQSDVQIEHVEIKSKFFWSKMSRISKMELHVTSTCTQRDDVLLKWDHVWHEPRSKWILQTRDQSDLPPVSALSVGTEWVWGVKREEIAWNQALTRQIPNISGGGSMHVPHH